MTGPRRCLDWLNFLLADVRGTLGPYLGVYLLTSQHWSQATIGVVMTVGGLIGLAANTPVGAFIDATRAKRGAVVVALTGLAVGALVMLMAPTFVVVLTANTVLGVAGAVFGPAISAITLGIGGRRLLARWTGRNAAFDHAGNVFIAAAAGAVGWYWSQQAVFCLVPVFAALSAWAVLAIPAGAIDHVRARGLDDGARGIARPAGLGVLLESRPLLVFAACAALFHFANAPMLPLVGQELALANTGRETMMMSACILAAQAIMLPMALLVGASADRCGRKPIFLAAFAILPIRGLLYTLSHDATWLIAVQLLDGIGAGLFGALTPLVLADLTHGTGRYNVSQGAVATVQGLGAALSSAVAGAIVAQGGYDRGFLVLATIAGVAFLVFWIAMPETAPPREPAAVRGSVECEEACAWSPPS